MLSQSDGGGMAEWFAKQNALRVCVNVEPANTAARELYEKYGADVSRILDGLERHPQNLEAFVIGLLLGGKVHISMLIKRAGKV
jgi:hypothetical protein